MEILNICIKVLRQGRNNICNMWFQSDENYIPCSSLDDMGVSEATLYLYPSTLPTHQTTKLAHLITVCYYRPENSSNGTLLLTSFIPNNMHILLGYTSLSWIKYINGNMLHISNVRSERALKL